MAKTPAIARSKSPVACISRLARARKTFHRLGGLLTPRENSPPPPSIAVPIVNFEVPDYRDFVNSLQSPPADLLSAAGLLGLPTVASQPTDFGDWGILPLDNSPYLDLDLNGIITPDLFVDQSALDAVPAASSTDPQPVDPAVETTLGSLAVDPPLAPVSVSPEPVASGPQPTVLAPSPDSSSSDPPPTSPAVDSNVTSLAVDSEPTVASSSELTVEARPASSSFAEDAFVASAVASEPEDTSLPPFNPNSLTMIDDEPVWDLSELPIVKSAVNVTGKKTPAAPRRARKRKFSDVNRNPDLSYPLEHPTYDYSKHIDGKSWLQAPEKDPVDGWLDFTWREVKHVFVRTKFKNKAQMLSVKEQYGWTKKDTEPKTSDDGAQIKVFCFLCRTLIERDRKTQSRHANNEEHSRHLATMVGFPLPHHKWKCEICDYQCRHGSESQHIASHSVNPVNAAEPLYIQESGPPMKRLCTKSTPKRTKSAKAPRRNQVAGPSQTADPALAAGPSHIAGPSRAAGPSRTPGSPRTDMPPPPTPSSEAGPSGLYVPLLAGLPRVRAYFERSDPRAAEALMSIPVPAAAYPAYAPAFPGYSQPPIDPSLLFPAGLPPTDLPSYYASGNLLPPFMPPAYPSAMPPTYPSARIPRVPTPPQLPVQDAPLTAPQESPAPEPSLPEHGTPPPPEPSPEEMDGDQVFKALVAFFESNPDAAATENAGSDSLELDFEKYMQPDLSSFDS